MRKILRIAKREYKASVQTKGFIIGLVLAPILFGGSAIAMLLLKDRVDTTDKKVAIVDRSGAVADTLVEAAKTRNDREIHDQKTGKKIKPAYLFEIVEPNTANPEAQRLELSNRVRNGQLHAFVEIGENIIHPKDNSSASRIAYHSKNAVMDDVRRWMDWPINNHLRRLRLADAGVDESTTQDCSLINTENLKNYDALIFATTGELPMSDEQKQAMLDFVKSGKAFIGIHNATDTFYKFPEYGEMIGGYFNGHPWTQEVVAIVEDGNHPSTRHLPSSFKVFDEIYVHRDWSRDKTHVLIRLDNNSVDLSKGNREDNDYALAWCHDYGEGRVFYTAFGHPKELWREEWLQKHLLEGILWAMKLAE